MSKKYDFTVSGGVVSNTTRKSSDRQSQNITAQPTQVVFVKTSKRKWLNQL
jgi:hypothetical protein